MIDKIKNFVTNAGADSESETSRNGFLSWSGEWHALGIGIARGSRDPYNLVSPLPDGDDEHYQDARNEPGYYYLGCVIGTVLQLGLVGVAVGLSYLGYGSLA